VNTFRYGSKKEEGRMKHIKSLVLLMLTIGLILGCQKIAEKQKSVSGFVNTVKSTKQLSSMIEDKKEKRDFSEEEIEELIEVGKKILENAKKIDYQALNKVYPELGDNFQHVLIEGYELVVKGYEEKDDELIRKGKKKIDSWGEWLEENLDNIKPLSYLKEFIK